MLNDKLYQKLTSTLPDQLKKNSLATNYPKLSMEWDKEKNGEMSPYNVSSGSSLVVWWRCKKGHSWRSTVHNRCNPYNKTGCPFCSGRKATKENNFAKVFPELLPNWDFKKNIKLNPTTITPHSNVRVWWKCNLGHSFDASVKAMTHMKKVALTALVKGS